MSLQLLNDTQKIIKEVKEISGKEIIFRENHSINTYAVVKIARTKMLNHIIYYKPVHNDIINYIIAHECGHIIRTFQEKTNRVIPYPDEETMKIAMEDIEKNSKAQYPDDIKKTLYKLWINGIVSQLTNVPEDIRIEKWIFNNYPEIRKSQKEALEKQSNDILGAIEPRIKEMTPDFLYNGSGVINYYYLMSINDIFKSNALNVMETTSFFHQAEKIFAEIKKTMEEKNSLSGSIRIVNYLAENLGFSNWFKWKDFENIPDGYENEVYY